MRPHEQGQNLRGIIELLLRGELLREFAREFCNWKKMSFAEFADYIVKDTLSFHHFAAAFVFVMIFIPGCAPLH
jgi:hypothetical protein